MLDNLDVKLSTRKTFQCNSRTVRESYTKSTPPGFLGLSCHLSADLPGFFLLLVNSKRLVVYFFLLGIVTLGLGN